MGRRSLPDPRDPPSCLGGAPWYAVEERQDDEWCNKNCCAPGCEVESGCCSYENGVSTGGSYDGVHEVCWDENPDPQKFPDWYHGCALCPGFDAGSQEKECLEGQGWIDDPKNCVDCGTVLEGSAPNPDTAECECPPNQIPSVDGTKCEVEPDTGTDPPSCLGGEWYPVEDWEGADEWCNKYCCADGCTVESGCCSYENGVSTGGSPGGVHQDCWDENPDPWAFPDWVHDCALCPGLDAGSQEKECLEGQGWIDDPKNCVDCNDVLKNSFPNAETGECECRIN